MAGPIIITGGGTAGHTNPGIAVAQALLEAGVDRDRILFVGGERGNEGQIVPEAGFAIELLPGRGIQRSLSPRAIKDNIGAVVALVRGLGRALGIVRTTQPAAVLCLGGYAAFGASLAATMLRVPLVVSEQNARASAVNRLFGRFSTTNALPYPDTDLPDGTLTGNPIRLPVLAAVRSADRISARAALGVPSDRVLVAVWAGSLGATVINEAVRELARTWSDRSDVAIHHVVGRRDWDDYRSLNDELASADLYYRAVEYEADMPSLQVAADLAICRAGASTTSELAVAGLPAVLVPLPQAPRDHQRANSRELVTAGGAVLMENGMVSASALASALDPLIADQSQLRQMSERASSVGRPEAAADVADLLLKAAGDRS